MCTFQLRVEGFLLQFFQFRLELVFVHLHRKHVSQIALIPIRISMLPTSCPIPTGFEIAAEISVPSSICSRISSISCSTLLMSLWAGRTGCREEEQVRAVISYIARLIGQRLRDPVVTHRLPWIPFRISLPRFIAFIVSMFIFAFSIALT